MPHKIILTDIAYDRLERLRVAFEADTKAGGYPSVSLSDTVEYLLWLAETHDDWTCDVLQGRDPVSAAAAALGRHKSAAKAAASRANGRKGGRPRKKPLMQPEGSAARPDH